MTEGITEVDIVVKTTREVTVLTLWLTFNFLKYVFRYQVFLLKK